LRPRRFGIGLAYDGGRVFATDATDDELWAFDAATGTVLWHSPPPASPVRRTVSIQPHTRQVISFSDPVLGPGSGLASVGVTASSTARVVIEKSVYSSNAADYGAGVTAGYTPAWGFF
jgi:outer membrane protein assembly factor BamB